MSDIQLVQSNFTNIAAQNVNKAFVYFSDCNLPLNVCVNYGTTSQTGNLCNYEYLKMLRFKILKSPPLRGVSFVVAKKIWREKCGYESMNTSRYSTKNTTVNSKST